MAPVTVVIIIAFIGGLLIHSYIAITVIILWLHRKPVTPIDQVLASLGISRMFFQIFSLLDLLLSIHQDRNLVPGFMIHSVVDSLFVFFNYSSIWFSTLFSVTFCLKISNFSHVLFLRLKRIVCQRTVSLISASLVVSIGYTLMYVYLLATEVGAQNVTIISKVSQSRLHYIILFLLGNIVPIGIYCSSSSLLIYSLWVHLRKMRNNNSPQISLNGYYMVINTMAFCFICYIFTVLSNVLVLCYIFMLQVLWIHIILNMFPIIHSIFVICKTAYLRQYFTVLYNLTVRRMLPGGASYSGDGVVTVN